jgi:WD40 repeat protein
MVSLQGFKEVARRVMFSPDDKLIGASGNDGSVRIWNVETRMLQMIYRQDGFVTCIAFSPDGKRVASAGVDAKIRIWQPIDSGPAAPSRLRDLRRYLDKLTTAELNEDSFLITPTKG